MTVSRFLFPILTSKSRKPASCTSCQRVLCLAVTPKPRKLKVMAATNHEGFPWFSVSSLFIPFHPFFLNLLIFSHPWRQYRNLLETEIAAFQWSAHLTRLQHICIIFHPNMIAVWMQQKTRISTGAQIETSFIKTQNISNYSKVQTLWFRCLPQCAPGKGPNASKCHMSLDDPGPWNVSIRNFLCKPARQTTESTQIFKYPGEKTTPGPLSN